MQKNKVIYQKNNSKTSKIWSKNPTAPKTAPYAYISYKRAPNFQNKDYTKMLLTLSIASQMELKPIYLHNLHNTLYLFISVGTQKTIRHAERA